ncbi:MAG TPA: hypothetical protein VN886_16625 [Acidimicrobiales bacterium]|jgi:hypothetical protein|nr:hypothetical protein [Acidimicrobiales bacterium]
MGVILGVVIGYALGSRAGPDAWTELEEAWHTIYTSEEVRDLLAGGVSIARELVEKRAEVIAGILGSQPTPRLKAA